jgi:hypothetical protein
VEKDTHLLCAKLIRIQQPQIFSSNAFNSGDFLKDIKKLLNTQEAIVLRSKSFVL